MGRQNIERKVVNLDKTTGRRLDAIRDAIGSNSYNDTIAWLINYSDNISVQITKRWKEMEEIVKIIKPGDPTLPTLITRFRSVFNEINTGRHSFDEFDKAYSAFMEHKFRSIQYATPPGTGTVQDRKLD